MNKIQDVRSMLETNMRLYGLPAPTEATLKRMQCVRQTVHVITWVTEKHEIENMTEVIDRIKSLPSIVGKGVTEEFEKDLLEQLSVNVLQRIFEDPKEVTLRSMSDMYNTRRLIDLPNIIQLIEFAVNDVEKGTTVCNRILLRSPQILKEVDKIKVEVHEYLEQQGEGLLFVDTETNSLPSKNRKDSGLPIQIAYILTDQDYKIKSKDSFYVLQSWIDPGAESVHGISLEKLKGLNPLQPTEAYGRIQTMLTSKQVTLIAHNSSFDIGVLKRLKEQADSRSGLSTGPYREPRNICTLKLARKLIDKKTLKSKALTSLMVHYGLTEQFVVDRTTEIFGEDCGAHDARFDTVLLMMLSEKLGVGIAEELQKELA